MPVPVPEPVPVPVPVATACVLRVHFQILVVGGSISTAFKQVFLVCGGHAGTEATRRRVGGGVATACVGMVMEVVVRAKEKLELGVSCNGLKVLAFWGLNSPFCFVFLHDFKILVVRGPFLLILVFLGFWGLNSPFCFVFLHDFQILVVRGPFLLILGWFFAASGVLTLHSALFSCMILRFWWFGVHFY